MKHVITVGDIVWLTVGTVAVFVALVILWGIFEMYFDSDGMWLKRWRLKRWKS